MLCAGICWVASWPAIGMAGGSQKMLSALLTSLPPRPRPPCAAERKKAASHASPNPSQVPLLFFQLSARTHLSQLDYRPQRRKLRPSDPSGLGQAFSGKLLEVFLELDSPPKKPQGVSLGTAWEKERGFWQKRLRQATTVLSSQNVHTHLWAKLLLICRVQHQVRCSFANGVAEVRMLILPRNVERLAWGQGLHRLPAC